MVFADKMHDILNALENDGVILYPTDTIWGLGCSALSERGITRIQELKQRIPDKPFLLLVDGIPMLKKFVDSIHPRIETLLAYHRRPLTVVYPRSQNLPPYAVAEDNSVAIRIAKDDFCKTLINLLGHPLVSTSANISGDPFPKSFNEVHPTIVQGVEYACKHRREDRINGNPSVMIRYNSEGELQFLRG